MNLDKKFYFILILNFLNVDFMQVAGSIVETTNFESKTTYLPTEESTNPFNQISPEISSESNSISTTLVSQNETTEIIIESSNFTALVAATDKNEAIDFSTDESKNSLNQITTEISSESSSILIANVTTLVSTINANETTELKKMSSKIFSKPPNSSMLPSGFNTLIVNETCETLAENTTLPSQVTTQSALSEFNTYMEISGLVRNKRRSSAKFILFKSNRVLFIEDTNITAVEQALLESLQQNATLTVKNEGNDVYSIDMSLFLNTMNNSDLSLDDSILGIINRLKEDEQKINTEANKVGFDLSIDTSSAVISANETLVINGTIYVIICRKSVGQSQMTCERAVQQNGTLVTMSTSQFQTVIRMNFRNLTCSYLFDFILPKVQLKRVICDRTLLCNLFIESFVVESRVFNRNLIEIEKGLKNAKFHPKFCMPRSKLYLIHDIWNNTRGSIFYNRMICNTLRCTIASYHSLTTTNSHFIDRLSNAFERLVGSNF
ncbi:hypothetical protein BpHYR1_008326 [Brachionus plicatilis]|uniref:Uncharacterized protein n=1 Tax=Brachionus plicatilis TaxID=10195 RepID=A0A3M7QJF6_BRAPC|nr:hypothetical protein BpHYR1_008326 [Brachionus plicatilis]